MDPMTLAMLISASAGAAGATGIFQPDVTRRQPAPPAGGGVGGSQPMGSEMMDMAYRQPPPPLQGIAAPEARAVPMGAPPVTDLEGASGPIGTQGKDGNNAKMSEIGDLIASIPEALAVAAPLLGLTGEENRKQPAPTAGSALQNQAASFQNLPRPPTLGELLAAMPRMR